VVYQCGDGTLVIDREVKGEVKRAVRSLARRFNPGGVWGFGVPGFGEKERARNAGKLPG
jgi:hypothetical protein